MGGAFAALLVSQETPILTVSEYTREVCFPEW